MATPHAGTGSKLKMGDGASPEVFTTIAVVSDINGPNLSAKTYDTTNHDNTSGYSEFITGLKDGGDISFSLFFDPAETTHKDAAGGLLYAYNQNTRKNWKIEIANSSPAATWTFAGVVTALSFKYPVDGAQTADCTIKVSGKPTLA